MPSLLEQAIGRTAPATMRTAMAVVLCCAAVFSGTGAWANPYAQCVQAARAFAGLALPESGAQETAVGGGAYRLDWPTQAVQCQATATQVQALAVAGQMLVVDGYAGAEAAELRSYMDGQINLMANQCWAQVNGIKASVAQGFDPKLRAPNPKLAQIKAQFQRNLDLASGAFYARAYSESVPKLRRLEAIEQILAKAEPDQRDSAQCWKLADEYSQLQLGAQENETALEGVIAEMSAQLEAQKTELDGLRAELARAQAALRDTADELRDYRRPKRVQALAQVIGRKDLDAAQDLFAQLSRDYQLSPKELRLLEQAAIEAIKPIPATNRRANFQGYSLLSQINPDEPYYQRKRQQYDPARSD